MQIFIQKQQPSCILNKIKPLILFFFFCGPFFLSCGSNSPKNQGKKATECKCIAGKDGIPILMPKQKKATIEELQRACSRLEGHLQNCP